MSHMMVHRFIIFEPVFGIMYAYEFDQDSRMLILRQSWPYTSPHFRQPETICDFPSSIPVRVVDSIADAIQAVIENCNISYQCTDNGYAIGKVVENALVDVKVEKSKK